MASCVPYVRINDRSLRVTERLSRASLSFSLPLSLSVFFLALLLRLSRSYQQSPHVVISDIQLIFQLVCFNIAGDVASYYSIKSFPFLQPCAALRRSRFLTLTCLFSLSRQKATIAARKNCSLFLSFSYGRCRVLQKGCFTGRFPQAVFFFLIIKSTKPLGDQVTSFIQPPHQCTDRISRVGNVGALFA